MTPPGWSVLIAALGCREDPPPAEPHPPGTESETGTGGTAATATTAETGTDPSADTCPACDDALECSIDRCDAQGQCLWEPRGDCPWLAPRAVPLADGLPELQTSLSGAVFDAVNQRLWVVRNAGPAGIWRLVRGAGESWVVDVDVTSGLPAAWVGLPELDWDPEGITLVDPVGHPDEVHLIAEETGQVVSLDLSTPGLAVPTGAWDLSSFLPTLEPLGPEGIAFVPDEVLASTGFVDGDGAPRISAGGMGGLMLVSHQNGGRIYAFDLFTTFGIAEHVGTYETARQDTSGLELDPVTERLYVWHGVTNDLEVVRLASTPGESGLRAFETEYLFDHPATPDVNMEGFALSGCAGDARTLWIITDDGGPGALVAYPDWPCPTR